MSDTESVRKPAQRTQFEGATTSDAATDAPIRVCYLINKLAPDGAPTIVLNLVQRAQAENIDCTVCFFGGDDTLREDMEAAGATVVDFGAVGEFPQFDPRSLPRMLRYFSNTSFDILHCHLPYSQSLGRLVASISDVDHVVSTQHNVPANYHPIERVAERVTRPLDSRTVAVSRGVQHAFTGESELYEPNVGGTWSTIPNGIDVEEFHRNVMAADGAAIRREWDIPDSAPLFVSVARYEPQKRQSVLIEAMEDLLGVMPDAHLLVVGWGSQEANLRAQVRDADLSDAVTITGRVPEIFGYYAAADVFVSSSAYEGLPVTILEAMAAKLPVVATDIDGVREVIVDGETGRLVPPDNPGDLADAMAWFDTKSVRSRCGDNGFERVKQEFTVEQMVERHLSLYREVVDRPA